MALQSSFGGAGSVAPVQMNKPASVMDSFSGLTQLMSLISTMQRFQNMERMQQMRDIDYQLKMRNLIQGGTAKERAEYAKRMNHEKWLADLNNNPEFQAQLNEAMKLSPTNRLKRFQDIKAKYITPNAGNYGEVDAQDIYTQLFGTRIADAQKEQEAIKDTQWDALLPNLKIGAHSLGTAIMRLLPGYDADQMAKDDAEYRKQQVNGNLYLKDQERRAAEGEGLWSRTNGIGGWLNLAAEELPTIGSFLLPGKVAHTGISLFAKGMDAVKAHKIATRANQIVGAGLGGALSDLGYSQAVQSMGLSPEKEKEALDLGAARLANVGVGSVTGALAPDIAGPLTRAKTMLSRQYRALGKAERAQKLADQARQQMIDMSRSGMLSNIARGAANTGIGMGVMNAGQAMSTNAALSAATGVDIPLTHGVGDAFISGTFTGGLLGGASRAHARYNMPYLTNDGRERIDPETFAANYKNAKPEELQKQMQDFGNMWGHDTEPFERFTKNITATPEEIQQLRDWYNIDKPIKNKPKNEQRINETEETKAAPSIEDAERMETIRSLLYKGKGTDKVKTPTASVDLGRLRNIVPADAEASNRFIDALDQYAKEHPEVAVGAERLKKLARYAVYGDQKTDAIIAEYFKPTDDGKYAPLNLKEVKPEDIEKLRANIEKANLSPQAQEALAEFLEALPKPMRDTTPAMKIYNELAAVVRESNGQKTTPEVFRTNGQADATGTPSSMSPNDSGGPETTPSSNEQLGQQDADSVGKSRATDQGRGVDGTSPQNPGTPEGHPADATGAEGDADKSARGSVGEPKPGNAPTDASTGEPTDTPSEQSGTPEQQNATGGENTPSLKAEVDAHIKQAESPDSTVLEDQKELLNHLKDVDIDKVEAAMTSTPANARYNILTELIGSIQENKGKVTTDSLIDAYESLLNGPKTIATAHKNPTEKPC